MKKFTSIIFAVLLQVIAIASSAQSVIKLSDVVIEGEIVKTGTTSQKGTVKIIISKYPFDLVAQARVDNQVYSVTIEYNKKFKFIIPALADRFYMHIIFDPLDGSSNWSWIDNEYILEKGDRIYCKLSSNYFAFSGIGAEKLNCQSEIYKSKYNLSDTDKILYGSKQWDKYVKLTSQEMDSCLESQMVIVEKYRPKLGDKLSEIMLASCYSLRYYAWIRTFRIQLGLGNIALYLSFRNSTAYKQINEGLASHIDPETLSESYLYTSFLFEQILTDNTVFENGGVKSTRSEEFMKNVFQSIQNKYVGIVRDKLICLFILNFISSSHGLNFLEEATGLVKSDLYKEILLSIKSSRLKGLPFYDFTLENSKGKLVKLSDLKGKVAIVDFWYTGCENCLLLKRAMEPVFEKYKNNPKVAFVSINIDKNKGSWIKSVAGGEYTDTSAVNLYTGGLGAQHPLLKTYHINGFPIVFILKDAKIYTTTPPRPALDQRTFKPVIEGETKKFIDMMEEALK